MNEKKCAKKTQDCCLRGDLDWYDLVCCTVHVVGTTRVNLGKMFMKKQYKGLMTSEGGLFHRVISP